MMSLLATINEKPSDVIYQGEDKNLRFYLYESGTKEYKDLTGLVCHLCLINTDNTPLALTGVLGTSGIVFFDITAAQSALLKLGAQTLQITFDDSGTLDIEVLSNSFTVIAKPC